MESVSAGSSSDSRSSSSNAGGVTSSSTPSSPEEASFGKQVEAASKESTASKETPEETRAPDTKSETVTDTKTSSSNDDAKTSEFGGGSHHVSDNEEVKSATGKRATSAEPQRTESDDDEPAKEFHTVKTGDTFDAIAKNNDLSRSQMMELNPQFSQIAGADGLTVDDFKIEYGKSKNKENDRIIDAIFPGDQLRIAQVEPPKPTEPEALVAPEAPVLDIDNTIITYSVPTVPSIPLGPYANNPVTRAPVPAPPVAPAPDQPPMLMKEPLPAAPEPLPSNQFVVSVKGIIGNVDDPNVEQMDAQRLTAMREIADVNGDGIVTPDEAGDFMKHADRTPTTQQDVGDGFLSEAEQRSVIMAEFTNANHPLAGPPSPAIEKAVESFTAKRPVFGPPTANQLVTMMSNKAAIGAFGTIIKSSNTALDFSSTRSQSYSSKALTPNTLRPFEAEESSKKKTNLTKDYKSHAWGAVSASISLSMPIATSNRTLRTATTDINLSIQPELILEAGNDVLGARFFQTGNIATLSKYSLTTDETRLESVLRGDEATPNPYTLEGFKEGDTVTLTTGKKLESFTNLRVLSPGKLRVGIEGKIDLTQVNNADRLVVRRLASDDPNVEHMLVFVGKSDEDIQHYGVGAIANPRVAPAGFVARATMGVEKEQMHNAFDFIAFDAASPEGRALYNNIIVSGEVPTAQMAQEIEGTLAHGALSFDQMMHTNKLSAMVYYEMKQKNPDTPQRKNRPQFLGFGALGLNTDTEHQRVGHVRYIDASLKDLSGNTEAGSDSLGLGGSNVSGTQFESRLMTETGLTRAIQTTRTEIGTNNRSQYTGVFDAATHKHQIISAIEAGIENQKAGNAPIIQSIIVETAQKGDLKGAEAIEHLNNYSDSNNQGWWSQLLGIPDRVEGVAVEFDTEEDAVRFFEMLREDTAASKQEFDDSFFSVYTLEGQANEMAVNSLFGQAQRPSNTFSEGSLARADTTQEQIKEITHYRLGALFNQLERLRGYRGSDETYPINVRVRLEE